MAQALFASAEKRQAADEANGEGRGGKLRASRKIKNADDTLSTWIPLRLKPALSLDISIAVRDKVHVAESV